MPGPSPILHATDFSPSARAAFREALRLARERKAPLTILHVVPLLAADVTVNLPPPLFDEMEDRYRRYAERALEKLVDEARKAGIEAAPLLRTGIPEEEVLRAARSLRPSALVMGTHGRRGISRIVLGSVATRVSASATCPVLIVRGRG